MRLLIALLAPCLFAAYPEVEYATRVDNASMGSNWTQSGAGFDIFSNTIRSVNTAHNNMAEWSAGSAPNADHYSHGVSDDWDARNGGATGGAGFRMDAAGNNGYACTIVANNSGFREIRIVEIAAGVSTTLTAGSSSVFSIPQNSKLTGWAVGSTLNCSLTNSAGTALTTAISTTDSTYTSGRVGLWRGASSTNITWKEWWGGNGTGNDIFVPPTTAGEFYMSATATGHNNSGSINFPWPFIDFYSNQSRIPCGSKLWIRGGTYSSDRSVYDPGASFFNLSVDCAADTEITYKVFPGEQVVYDAAAPCATNSAYALMIVTGDYSILDGGYNQWRMTNSDGSCVVLTTCGSNPFPNPVRGAFNQADFVKYRGLVWHDFGDGSADNGANADGTEVTDQISFNIGWNAPDRGHGHCYYAHNDGFATIRKTIRDTIGLRCVATQGKIFSQSGAPVGNFLIDSVAFIGGRNDSGTWRGTGTGGTTLIQGGTPDNITFNKVFTYAGLTQINLDAVPLVGFQLTNSILDGGYSLSLANAAVVTNNVFSRYGTPNGAPWFLHTYATATWNDAYQTIDYNTYFNNRVGEAGFSVNSTDYRFSPGFVGLGQNANSTNSDTVFPAVTISPSGSSPTYVNVLPSPINPGTGNVIVYNWPGASSVNADVSTILSVGDPYEVIDAQCWSCGPVSTGIYAGGNIALDMTLTAIQTPVGNYTASPGSTCTAGRDGGKPAAHDNTFWQHTEPYFGAFVVRRRQVTRQVVMSTLNDHTGSTQVLVESGPSSTTLNFPQVTVACSVISVCSIPISTQMIGNTWYRQTFKDAGGATVWTSPVLRVPVE